ncbi:hypothetical protein [Thermococcus sp. Bubb.Bath]|uniref:hypothetical protein n=1 Tax=Thermococcus sp. Bubb.Bath TaxID=1638242 RepID=UPI00143A182C|nr:hypothetical protein [Thermococcus sp. Bubb.Bath]NJF24321.1 hypothetical protein [Thermococcus sp. Bubb.Bath]
MNIGPMVKHYSKVFLSFLFLVFLVAVIPATASAIINQVTEMRHGEFSGEYFSFWFVPKGDNHAGIVYLKNGEALTGAEPPRPVRGSGGFSVNDIRSMFANAWVMATEVYLPLWISDYSKPGKTQQWTVLVPLVGGNGGADCYVSDEKTAEKIKGTEIKYHYSRLVGNGYYDGIATIRVGTVGVLSGSDERSKVLRAILKRWEKYRGNACVASPDFAREFLRPYGIGDDLENLSVGTQGIIVITDGSQSIEDIHRALSREAARYNLSVAMRVLTPRWVSAVESSGGSIWDYLWGYVALLLPVLPALLVIMGREKEDEERMRYLISTNGGRKIVLDLITAGTVLFALTLTALFLDRRASLLSVVMLLLIYTLRNFVAGKEFGERSTLVVLSLIFLGILGIALQYNLRLRLYASGVLGYLFSLGNSDASLLLFGVTFRYLPEVLVSVGLLSLLFPLLRRRRPQQRAAAKLLFAGMISIGVLFLYSSLLFSAPLVSLASISDLYGGGATGVVNFANSDNLSKAYNLTLGVVSQKDVTYATLWEAGTVVEGSGMTYSTHGRLLCYARDFLEFLKKAGGISMNARLLHSQLSSSPEGIIIPKHYLEELKAEGIAKVSGGSLTLSVVDEGWKVHNVSAPYETVEMLPGGIESPIVSCQIARRNGLNPRPAYLLLYGNSRTTGEVMEEVNGTIIPEYPEAFEKLWSMGDVSTHVESQFKNPRGLIPPLLSGVLMAITGIVMGFRDGERLSGLAKLMRVNGEEPLSSLVPVLLPTLILIFVPASMIWDGYSFASMGFIGKKLVLIGLSPLLGVFAGLALYFILLLGNIREV